MIVCVRVRATGGFLNSSCTNCDAMVAGGPAFFPASLAFAIPAVTD